MSNVHIVEDHSEAYLIWKKAGVFDSCVFHFDEHLDMALNKDSLSFFRSMTESTPDSAQLSRFHKPKQYVEYAIDSDGMSEKGTVTGKNCQGFHCGNYMVPAVFDGTVSRFVWIAPDYMKDRLSDLPGALHEMERWIDPLDISLELHEESEFHYAGHVDRSAFELCTLDSLDLEPCACLDIDLDYCIDKSNLPWVDIPSFTERLSSGRPFECTTVSCSVSGGYVHFKHKYIAEVLAACLSADTSLLDMHAQFMLCDQHASQGRYSQALDELSLLKTENCFQQYVLIREIELLQSLEENDLAKEAVENFLLSYPDERNTFYEIALYYLDLGDIVKAEKMISICLVCCPEIQLKSRLLWYWLLLKKQEPERARVEFDQILESNTFGRLSSDVRKRLQGSMLNSYLRAITN